MSRTPIASVHVSNHRTDDIFILYFSRQNPSPLLYFLPLAPNPETLVTCCLFFVLSAAPAACVCAARTERWKISTSTGTRVTQRIFLLLFLSSLFIANLRLSINCLIIYCYRSRAGFSFKLCRRKWWTQIHENPGEFIPPYPSSRFPQRGQSK